ncbi:MAG: DUF domain-containing protein [Candidatus Saccharimonadales bacterium]
MPPQKSAPVHSCYKEGQCIQCSYQPGKNTSNWSKQYHIKHHHPLLYKELIEKKQQDLRASASASSEPVSSTPAAKKRRSEQTSLDYSMKIAGNKALIHIIAIKMACLGLPLQLIERHDFLDLLYAFRASTDAPPTRQTLRLAQTIAAQQLRQQVLNAIRRQSVSAPVTIAYDGWTNVKQEKVTNVIPLCGGKAYYWQSIVNTVERNTAEWVSTRLKDSLDSLADEGVMIVAIVADNESVNQATYKRLVVEFPFLVQVPCAAHTLQLIVKKIINLPVCKKVVTDMTKILSAFSSNKSLRHELILSQSRSPQQLTLVKPCDTRWSSSYYAAERMVKLRNHIEIIIQDKDDIQLEHSFWLNLMSLVECLKPYQAATDVLQADNALLYTVYTQFSSLLITLNALQSNDFLYQEKAAMVDILKSYWMKNINVQAVITCAHLSFDANTTTIFDLADRTTAQAWFEGWAVDYLMHYELSEMKTRQSVLGAVQSQFGSFIVKGDMFSDLTDRIDNNKQKSLECNKKAATEGKPAHYFFNPKEIWNQYVTSAPEITHAAIALLSIVPSEAAVERSFSLQDMIHSKRRNRLKASSVQSEMFIRWNYHALHQTLESQGNYIELNDYNCEQSPAAIPGLFAGLIAAEHKQVPDAPHNDQQQREEESGMMEDQEEVEEKEEEERGEEELQEEEEEEEQQEEEEEEEEEGAEEEQSILPDPALSPTDKFIKYYIKKYKVHAKYNWKDRILQLEVEAAAWKINDMTEVLRKKIMRVVEGRLQEVQL